MSVGRVVAGKYRLVKELGTGSMGSVWLAEHLALRSQVAIKLIHQRALAVRHASHRFEREARVLATLRSPHVVQILDYGDDAGSQYLVMELLNGETLRARLEARGRLDVSEVWTIAKHVARAMTVSHAAGFAHRDLKPDNVFLTTEGEKLVVKVLDFGITKNLAEGSTKLTEAGMMLGTCHYMSAEQVKGDPIDSRSDLWSLGAIVFECLTGQLAFPADSVFAAVTAICSAPIVVPSQVSRVPVGFDAWFARAVSRDIEQRFQTASELLEALRPVLEAPRDWVGSDGPELEVSDDEETVRIHAFTTSESERRSEVRVPSSIPAGIDGQRNFANTALVYNASRSGALLTTQCALRPEQALKLTLYLDSPTDGELVSARVVRCTHRDDLFWKYEVAVRFVKPLAEDLLARIEAKSKGRAQ